MTGWLSQPCAQAINPGERHWLILSRLLQRAGTAGNLTNDAHLAAIAIEHNARLYSADNDFRRFDGLNFENPLDGFRLQDESARY
ncbi:MAG: PIN domain-containing protein [Xanthomonadales bacterium]|nr:PIN domain-containing protein [Xanthomonadales bacterium]